MIGSVTSVYSKYQRRSPGFRHMVTSTFAVLLLLLTALAGWGVTGGTRAEDAPALREFTLTAEEIDWEIQPGETVKAWAYNGQVPGPEIRVNEGDKVRITLKNRLPVGTTIHWHGLDVPNDMDGPAELNQAPVQSGQDFVYEFVAKPSGTRWYHSHTDVTTQVALGLYGAFIVIPKEQKHYDEEFTYVLSEWDSELTPDVARGVAPRGPRDQTLRGGELGTDLFLLNGRAGDAIDPMIVKTGDRFLIRLINAGNMAHPFHIHGHTFKIVATDGNPVPEAAQLSKDTILIAPGERYDLALEANNPGVWMVHCHIENHAENGMMTYLQYDGYLPTGPLKEIWASPEAGMGDMHSGDDGSSSPEATPSAPESTASPSSVETTNDGENTVTIVDNRFHPRTLTVKVGTTVTWYNQGGNHHTAVDMTGVFNSGDIAPGGSFSYTFTTPGSYDYVCRNHRLQGMRGTIVVTE